jgi:dCTP deaminase
VILSGEKLASEITKGNAGDALGVAIIPEPSLEDLRRSGEASVTLRLGRWLLAVRPSNETHIEAFATPGEKVQKIAKQYFVPFGSKFILHPGRFVLAVTLEWLRLPSCYTAFVVGKSSLGRRGIIIETAAGVHPGFSGCLTLEVANVGELPVALVPGQPICQLFLHSMDGALAVTTTAHAGQRKPRLGQMKSDRVLENLISSADF